jgi:hypothetical protein
MKQRYSINSVEYVHGIIDILHWNFKWNEGLLLKTLIKFELRPDAEQIHAVMTGAWVATHGRNVALYRPIFPSYHNVFFYFLNKRPVKAKLDFP